MVSKPVEQRAKNTGFTLKFCQSHPDVPVCRQAAAHGSHEDRHGWGSGLDAYGPLSYI